jgi:hypothetical protein
MTCTRARRWFNDLGASWSAFEFITRLQLRGRDFAHPERTERRQEVLRGELLDGRGPPALAVLAPPPGEVCERLVAGPVEGVEALPLALRFLLLVQRPVARAFAMPSLVRSRMRSRSNSATAASIVRMRRDLASPPGLMSMP